MSGTRYRGRPANGADAPPWRLAHFLRVTVGKLLLALFRTRVIGIEKVPAGRAILAGNHVSYLDPILLWACAPRPTHFIAKAELWDSAALAWLLDRVWVFPVRRGTADREMITTATSLLENDELLGMFPEGTRSHSTNPNELGEARGGVSFIALRANAPIVPVRISGTDKAWGRGRKVPRISSVTIRFLEPVHPDAFVGGRKERMEAVTAEVMKRIANAGTPTEGS